MGVKLLVVLLILGIHVSEGGKLVKKLSKELKKVLDGEKFDDFLAHTIFEILLLKDVVAENSNNITSNSDNIANNSVIISHNSEKIHRVFEHVAANVASIQKNAMDIAHHNPSKWIMVATGNVGSMANPSNVVETINMKVSQACHTLPQYPVPVKMANGMMINGVQIIAGGGDFSGPISEVYKLDHLSNSWVLLGNMAETRKQFAVAELDGGLWAMGGLTTNNKDSMDSSTEIIYPDGTILDGPELPEARAGHCAVTLPNGKVVIMGGRTSKTVITKDVLFYDPSTSTFASGNTYEQMTYERETFACTHFYSDKHLGRPVILSAGGSSAGGSSKAEIYDYVNGCWEEIPDIPSPYSASIKGGPKAVPSLDGKGAFLQHGENFFELTCNTSSCTWSVMEQTLDVGRVGAVMMYLPSVFECDRGCEDNSHVKHLSKHSAPEDIFGWITTCNHGSIYGSSVATCPNWHIYFSGSPSCHIETTLNGSGHAKIDFGNCFNDGEVKVFLDGNEIASAGGNEFNVVKEFDYTDGSELKLFETGNGVISFNSFEVLTC